MISFKKYLYEAAVAGKNTHMLHIDDLVLYGGADGVQQAIASLKSLAASLSGGDSSSSVTVKWDGCVSPDTIITSEVDGDIKIIDYIEKYKFSEEYPKVLAKDIESNTDAFVNVYRGSLGVGNKNWIYINLENKTSIKLTEDHEVYTTNRGWIKAIELCEGDDICEKM